MFFFKPDFLDMCNVKVKKVVVWSTKRWKKVFLYNRAMWRLYSFGGHAVDQFGLANYKPEISIQLGLISTLTILSFVQSVKSILICRFISKNFALQTTVHCSIKMRMGQCRTMRDENQPVLHQLLSTDVDLDD